MDERQDEDQQPFLPRIQKDALSSEKEPGSRFLGSMETFAPSFGNWYSVRDSSPLCSCLSS